MKAFVFVVAVALGFWLTGVFMQAGRVSLPAAATPAQGRTSVRAAQPSDAPSSNADTPPNTSRAATPKTPARAAPNAFFLGSFLFRAPDTTGLSAEDIADPEFAELYRRVLAAHAKNRLAPFVLALGLDPAQFDLLRDVMIEQSLELRRRDREKMNSKEHEEFRAELSRAAEARLSTALSAEQMDRLAGLKYNAQWFGALVEAYAQRGAPLPRERMAELIVPQSQGTVESLTLTEFNPPPAWMTEPQRRHVADQHRWNAAFSLKEAARSVWVKDPDLREIWPK